MAEFAEHYTVFAKHSHEVAKLGGNCNNGANAGLFYWNVNNASSNSNWNIGSHLVCCCKVLNYGCVMTAPMDVSV